MSDHGHMIPRAIARSRRVTTIDANGNESTQFEVYYEYEYEYVPTGMLTVEDETFVRQAAERPHRVEGEQRAQIFDHAVSDDSLDAHVLDTLREREDLIGLGDFDSGDDT